MPFALVIIGLLMVISGIMNTHTQLGKQLREEFTGPGNFTWWLLVMVFIGGLGYVERLRPVASAFLVLVIVSLFIANKGVFAKATQALQSGPVAAPTK